MRLRGQSIASYVQAKRYSAHKELAAWTRDKALGLGPGQNGTSSQTRRQGPA